MNATLATVTDTPHSLPSAEALPGPGAGVVPDPVAEAGEDAVLVIDGQARTVSQVLAAITAGTISGAALDPPARRQVVEQLDSQGLDAAQIATRLGVTERTIRRDREVRRAQQAIAPSLTLTHEVLGEFYRLTMLSVQRLSAMASDPHTPPYARLWAEDTASRTYARFVEAARKLDHLPRIDPRPRNDRIPNGSQGEATHAPVGAGTQCDAVAADWPEDEAQLPPEVRELNTLLRDMRTLNDIGKRMK